MGERLLRLGPSGVVRERRLAELLDGREHERPRLLAAVEDACLLGSLELAGCEATWEQVASRSASAHPEVAALRRARSAVDRAAPLSRATLLAWHAALGLAPAGFRRGSRPEGRQPAGAPAEFIGQRLDLLEGWLSEGAGRELKAAQAGALALARLCEIAPFEDGNGRVARLAASHLMERAGARPPVLVGRDRARLEESLRRAFALDTAPLVELLDEASQRALDVMLQALAAGGWRAVEPRGPL